MRYTVTWRKVIEADLARIWLSATDQQAIAEAANELDQQLKRDPYFHAKKAGANTWALIVDPLRIQSHSTRRLRRGSDPG